MLQDPVNLVDVDGLESEIEKGEEFIEKVKKTTKAVKKIKKFENVSGKIKNFLDLNKSDPKTWVDLPLAPSSVGDKGKERIKEDIDIIQNKKKRKNKWLDEFMNGGAKCKY